MDKEIIFKKILDCAFKVHKELGPGLFENVYEECLFYELNKAGLFVEKQKIIPMFYKEIKFESGYRADLVVENKIIVEVKAIESFNDIHLAQILTYMKLFECQPGLLLNFNVKYLKQGIKRVII